MQIVLVVAAVVSLIIGEWGTAVGLALLTLFNAWLGYHQEGKAHAAAAALGAMLQAVAKVRRGGSVLEVAAAGLPAVLVPYPHATADHQTHNARWMEQAGAAVVVPDGELDGPRLAREVGALLAAPQRLREMAAAAAKVARTDAAELIAREALAAAGGKSGA